MVWRSLAVVHTPPKRDDRPATLLRPWSELDSKGSRDVTQGHRLFEGRTPTVLRDWVVDVEDGRIGTSAPARERRRRRMPVMSLILAMSPCFQASSTPTSIWCSTPRTTRWPISRRRMTPRSMDAPCRAAGARRGDHHDP